MAHQVHIELQSKCVQQGMKESDTHCATSMVKDFSIISFYSCPCIVLDTGVSINVTYIALFDYIAPCIQSIHRQKIVQLL